MWLTALLALMGCWGKSTSMPVQFDNFNMVWYTNGKIYSQQDAPPAATMPILYEAKQDATGTTNSLIITKAAVSSGASADEIIKLNAQQLAEKLLNYKATTPQKIYVTCNNAKFTGYSTSFTYDLNKNQKFSVFQYYFIGEGGLYLISLQSSDAKDITPMVKSLKTIACK